MATGPSPPVKGAPECSLVLTSDTTHHRMGNKHSAVADSATDIAGVVTLAGSGSSSSTHGSIQLKKGQLDNILQPAAAAAAGPAAAAKPRTFYVDWLRAFLTVLVVLHHCMAAYQSNYAWAAKRGDTALWLLSQLFVGANQAYFMTLFFFMSGLFVPGSYRRKGTWSFLWDRSLRLVVPCLVYSFVAPPFILMLNEMAKSPSANVGQVWANFYRLWLKPGWPTTYILATGPPWFVWMLWCFNVAYVILVALASKVLPALKRARTRDDSAASLTQLPTTTSSRSRSSSTKVAQDGTFTTAELLRHSAWLTAILCTTCFAVRMINVFQYNIKPAQFVQRGPFVQFMPDFLPVYAAAFALGIFSGPSAWNVLARLPDQWGSWCLWVAGVWWVLAGWLLNVTLHPWMSMQYGKAAYVLTWLLRTFVEQSFCVYWSIGLLVVFRLAYNTKPGWVGRQYINGAYGAYLVHLPLVFLLARAFMSFSFQSAVVNAVIIAPFAVAGSWLIACALRAIPGADRVL